MKHALIRFSGHPNKAYHYLKLGPMNQLHPPVLEFTGGEEVAVTIESTKGVPHCFDLVFDDGQFALEVPAEIFEVLRESDGR